MKKLLLTFVLLMLPNFATSVEIPKNIDEYLNKSYLGMSYSSALQQETPFLLIFANPNDLLSLAKLSGIGEMVYNEFRNKYNFCVINTKAQENELLYNAFAPKKLPALYIIDTQSKTYVFIDKKYYKKRELRQILTHFSN